MLTSKHFFFKMTSKNRILNCFFCSLLLPKIRVRIGEWDFSSTSESHPHVERKIVEKIVHSKYNYFTYEYDLALLKLDKRVDFHDNIIPICLPGNDDLLIGKLIRFPLKLKMHKMVFCR